MWKTFFPATPLGKSVLWESVERINSIKYNPATDNTTDMTNRLQFWLKFKISLATLYSDQQFR